MVQRQAHVADQKLLVDFAGDTVPADLADSQPIFGGPVDGVVPIGFVLPKLTCDCDCEWSNHANTIAAGFRLTFLAIENFGQHAESPRERLGRHLANHPRDYDGRAARRARPRIASWWTRPGTAVPIALHRSALSAAA